MSSHLGNWGDSVVNLEGPVPAYHQIKHDLQQKILNNELKPDDRVPSEETLARNYGVSRMTARHAISELVNQGYLYRVHGKGTFVSRPKIERSYAPLTGFIDDMRERGIRPSSKLLGLRQVIPDPELRSKLHLSPGIKVYQITRLRYANAEPIVIQVACLPQPLCPGLETEDLENNSLYAVLEKRYDIHLDRAQQRLEATRSTPEQARLLQIRPGDPLLYVYRLSFLADGTPVEFVESWYRSDRYAFEVTLYKDWGVAPK
ncbi:HTH-type transcriptional repressor YvoA [Neomoorella glycerini]|uniref:HTH-type transcriptional repressor YvoA n=1 Tax=Neomoorella glycerini TaxID=55779 RepID=A0A6I5ZQK2_9FIRM|nr:GntR family transcriptional regulator [Moorella glycerini]QGP92273.1 HTH-type transcriptional repressor YvoA [Moorella glycerini]